MAQDEVHQTPKMGKAKCSRGKKNGEKKAIIAEADVAASNGKGGATKDVEKTAVVAEAVTSRGKGRVKSRVKKSEKEKVDGVLNLLVLRQL